MKSAVKKLSVPNLSQSLKAKSDAELKKQGWNTQPRSYPAISCTANNPLVNAAKAIAISAYPRREHLAAGGKTEKYTKALLAYTVRVSKLMGELESLPPWVANMSVESMQRHLDTGHRNLERAFVVRDIIFSALTMKIQRESKLSKHKVPFVLGYSPDMRFLNLEFPVEEALSGYILSRRIPDTKLASLRAAILYHRPALKRFEGPAVKVDGHDSEFDCQNTFTRYVKPALFAQHILQKVWEQAAKHLDESRERNIPIDQILMRKAVWATNIHRTTNEGMGAAIYFMRKLGVPSCACEMVRFADPLPNS